MSTGTVHSLVKKTTRLSVAVTSVICRYILTALMVRQECSNPGDIT